MEFMIYLGSEEASYINNYNTLGEGCSMYEKTKISIASAQKCCVCAFEGTEFGTWQSETPRKK